MKKMKQTNKIVLLAFTLFTLFAVDMYAPKPKQEPATDVLYCYIQLNLKNVTLATVTTPTIGMFVGKTDTITEHNYLCFIGAYRNNEKPDITIISLVVSGSVREGTVETTPDSTVQVIINCTGVSGYEYDKDGNPLEGNEVTKIYEATYHRQSSGPSDPYEGRTPYGDYEPGERLFYPKKLKESLKVSLNSVGGGITSSTSYDGHYHVWHSEGYGYGVRNVITSNTDTLYTYTAETNDYYFDELDKVVKCTITVTATPKDGYSFILYTLPGEGNTVQYKRDPVLVYDLDIMSEPDISASAMFAIVDESTGIAYDITTGTYESPETFGVIRHPDPEQVFSGAITVPETYDFTSNHIILPVTSVGDSAFAGFAGITSLSVPASVTSIGSSAFKGCSGLSSVTMSGMTAPTLGADAFRGIPANADLYIPLGSRQSYLDAGYEDYFAPEHIHEAVTMPDCGNKSLYLPYAVTVPDGLTILYAEKVKGNFVTLTALEGNVIPAGTAVLIHGYSGNYDLTGASGTLPQSPSNLFRGTATEISYNGGWTWLDGSDGDVYVLDPDLTEPDFPMFTLFDHSATLAPFKAFLPVSAAPDAKSKQIRFQLDERATSIISARKGYGVKQNTPTKTYSLSGQLMRASQRGVVIEGGRKYLHWQ